MKTTQKTEINDKDCLRHISHSHSIFFEKLNMYVLMKTCFLERFRIGIITINVNLFQKLKLADVERKIIENKL